MVIELTMDHSLARKISRDLKPYIIAEACINHQGDINIAKQMIDIASSSGVSAVKFQIHDLDDEMLRDTPISSNFNKSLYETLLQTSLSLDEHKHLKSYCNHKGVDYLCTPFSRKSADLLLHEIGVDLIKTGSGEFTNPTFLNHLAGYGLPMLVSTGMSSYEDVRVFKANFDHVAPQGYVLMHCVSAYPCPPEIVNLDVLTEYQILHGPLVGLSDHTDNIWTAIGAVALGAVVIEKHFTLNKGWPGPDHRSSIDPPQLEQLVSGCYQVWSARGSRKEIFAEELQITTWAHASVVTTQDIAAGEVLSSENISTKRPAPIDQTYIAAKNYMDIIGKSAISEIKRDEQIKWSQLKP